MFVCVILERIPDDHEAIVTFDYGDCFGLSNFEMVDESIYESLDFCLSDIVSKVKVLRDVYNIGTKLEFSVNDVLKVEDAVSGGILYRKSNET